MKCRWAFEFKSPGEKTLKNWKINIWLFKGKEVFILFYSQPELEDEWRFLLVSCFTNYIKTRFCMRGSGEATIVNICARCWGTLCPQLSLTSSRTQPGCPECPEVSMQFDSELLRCQHPRKWCFLPPTLPTQTTPSISWILLNKVENSAVPRVLHFFLTSIT